MQIFQRYIQYIYCIFIHIDIKKLCISKNTYQQKGRCVTQRKTKFMNEVSLKVKNDTNMISKKTNKKTQEITNVKDFSIFEKCYLLCYPFRF